MDSLKDYATFLKKNHLRELALENLAIIRTMDVPLMKIVEGLPEGQVIELTIKGLNEFLTYIEEGIAREKAQENLLKWENDQLEGVSKNDIQPTDLVLVYAAQSMAIQRFIPKYTDSSTEAIRIVNKLSEYYSQTQEAAFQVLFRIRKEAEDALVESEERFRAVSQSAVNGIVIFDLQFNVNFWNRAAEDILGYTEEEMLGRSILMIYPPEIHETLEVNMEKFRADRGTMDWIGKAFELECVSKNGRRIPVEIAYSYFETSRGSFCSAIIHDITDRKKAAEELEEQTRKLSSSNEELEQFAYVASHDLKEPLRMVSNYVQLLARKYDDQLDEDARQYISFAREGATRMRSLINDLLEYSRINVQERPLQKVNMNSVIEDVLTNLSELIREKKAVIYKPEMPVVTGDPVQLSQLFQNLVNNSIKFIGQNKTPEIRIISEEFPFYWKFSVKDNGIGINPEFKGKIFKMFQRLHRRDEYPGTGIGLALCKKIVERHKGRIWFDSIPGEGTTFSFTISKI